MYGEQLITGCTDQGASECKHGTYKQGKKRKRKLHGSNVSRTPPLPGRKKKKIFLTCVGKTINTGQKLPTSGERCKESGAQNISEGTPDGKDKEKERKVQTRLLLAPADPARKPRQGDKPHENKNTGVNGAHFWGDGQEMCR